MSQSNLIFGTLLLAFIIYITSRGQLPEYIRLFTEKGSATGIGSDKSGSTSIFGVKGTSLHKYSTNTPSWLNNILGGIQNTRISVDEK